MTIQQGRKITPAPQPAMSQAANAVAAAIEAAATTGDRNAGVAEANLQAAKSGRR